MLPATSVTKLVRANTSKSLRVTVPSHIIHMLELEEGDGVEWIVRPHGKEFSVLIKFVRKKGIKK